MCVCTTDTRIHLYEHVCMHYRHTYTLVRACVYALQTHVYTCTSMCVCTIDTRIHLSRWQGLPLSILAAHQRQRHDGRACPCERVFHAQVCALQITHISILAARQRQCHDGRACPCERVFHARVCALSAHTSLFSQHVQDSATTTGLAPASVCSTLGCVHSTAHISLSS